MKKVTLFCSVLILFSLTFLSAQTYVSGPVTGVWEIGGSPYLVTGELNIPTDSTLRIMPGVEVIFQWHYVLKVDSAAVLKAIGTETDSITFFPEDTSVWSPGWQGIRFYNASDACSLAYCEIAWGMAYGFSVEDSCGGGIFW